MKDVQVRGPLMLDTRRLARRPGAMVELTRRVPAPADLGTDIIAVAEGENIDLDVRLESVLEGILVSGTARTRAMGGCTRCLDDVDVDVDVPFQELFAYTDRAAHHHHDARAAHHHDAGTHDDADEYVLTDGLLDLEPLLRDAMIPTLPFQPVCRPDCPGLCAECGAHLADDPTHAHERIDPRWAALATHRPAHHPLQKRN